MVPLRPSTLTLFNTKSFHFGTLCSILGQRLNIYLPVVYHVMSGILMPYICRFLPLLILLLRDNDEVSQGRISGIPGTVF